MSPVFKRRWISQERRRRIGADWRRLSAKPAVSRSLVWVQRALFVSVIVYLIFRLSHVGWLEVLDNLPASPWFYAFFTARYFIWPLSEIPAYERVWRLPLWRYFGAFVRKRVYNFAIVGYSGEAFFTLWARRRLALSDADILAGIKDNNILSAFASNISTVALIVILALGDNLKPGLDALPGAVFLFSVAFMSSFVLVAAVMAFGNKVLHVSLSAAVDLSVIHGARMLAVMALHAAMYAAAAPGAPYVTWVLFVALQLVISRVPFLPNQDLVFLGAALSLAPITGLPEAAIAGMLVAEAGLSQAFNVALFLATVRDAKHRPRTNAPEADAAPEDGPKEPPDAPGAEHHSSDSRKST